MRTLILPALLAIVGCSAGRTERMTAMPAANRTLTIELLALDLDTCGRCTGTSANLDAAIAEVAAILRQADVEVEVHKVVVRSAAQAEQLRFESSPTIRINGCDIALELRESNCGDCGDLCGCEGQIDCRVWVWRGEEYTEAPKALIVDAILRGYGQAWDPPPKPARRFRLPDNLRRFFDANPDAAARAEQDCCDRSACCDEADREACCGVEAGHPTCRCKI